MHTSSRFAISSPIILFISLVLIVPLSARAYTCPDGTRVQYRVQCPQTVPAAAPAPGPVKASTNAEGCGFSLYNFFSPTYKERCGNSGNNSPAPVPATERFRYQEWGEGPIERYGLETDNYDLMGTKRSVITPKPAGPQQAGVRNQNAEASDGVNTPRAAESSGISQMAVDYCYSKNYVTTGGIDIAQCEADQQRILDAGGTVGGPVPIITGNDSPYYSNSEMQDVIQTAFDACNSTVYPDACKAEVMDRYGMSYTPTNPDANPDNWDLLGDRSRYGLTPQLAPAPTPVVSAVAQSAEDIRNAPSERCFTGWLLGLNSTFLGRWSGCNTGTPSAPAPQPVAPGAQTVPEAVQPQNASGFRPVITPATAEDFARTPDAGTGGREAEGPSLWRRFTDSVGFTRPEPPAPMYDPNRIYPDNRYYGASISDDRESDYISPEELRRLEAEGQGQATPETSVAPPPAVSTAGEASYIEYDNTFRNYQVQYYNESTDSMENWYGGSDDFIYTAPTRQFSQAQPLANPFENQSLIAGVLGALLGN